MVYSFSGIHTFCLGFDSVFACWELWLLALLLQSQSRCVAVAECSSQCASLLRSQVQWLELLALVELAKIVLRLLIHDDVHTSDGFAHNTTKMRNKKWRSIVWNCWQYESSTYILDSFDGAPPVTLATRRVRSSFLSSSSCLVSSFLSFWRSSEHLTLPWKTLNGNRKKYVNDFCDFIKYPLWRISTFYGIWSQSHLSMW